MKNITTASLFFLAAGIFTSVSILSAFQILFIIPLMYFSFKAFKEKSFKDLPPSTWFLIFFFFWGCLTVFLNLESVPEMSKNLRRLLYFLYGSLGIFVLNNWIEKVTDKTKMFLMNTFFLSIIVASTVAIYKVTHLGGRSGGFLHYMRYGYGQSFIVSIFISSLLNKKYLPQWVSQKFAATALCFALIGLVLSQTRGAMLGLICSLPFSLYFYKPRLGKISILVIGLLVSGMGLFYFFGQSNYSSRYLMNKNNSSDNVRYNLWTSAIYAASEKPIIGWGYSNGNSQFKRISEREKLHINGMENSHAHNLFLDILAGTGFIGLGLFIGWLFFWCKEVLNRPLINKAIVIPFVIAFVISSIFEVTINSNLASMTFILYAFSSLKINKHSYE